MTPVSDVPMYAEVVSRLDSDVWQRFADADILITGGTGFVGKWLVGALLSANAQLDLGLRLTLLSRDPDRFTAACPELACNEAVSMCAGDVRSCCEVIPEAQYRYVIHAATEASAKMNAEDPLGMIDTVVTGTREILRFAQQRHPDRLLFISSGAVYGPQPHDLAGFSEGWLGGPDVLGSGSAYHEAKRLAEQMCSAAARMGLLKSFSVARLFAFVGPHLPMDSHFAVGNFLLDAIAGREIQIRGDGTAVRSYLYAADMAAWILKILVSGRDGEAYNVGSDRGLNMVQLAESVLGALGVHSGYQVHGKAVAGAQVNRYVPNVDRVRDELGLDQWTDFAQAIAKTAEWLQLSDNNEGHEV